MTIPMGGVRMPNNAGNNTAQMGPPYVQARVLSIDVDLNVAKCKDSLSRLVDVRLDVQRSKGQMPEVGEDWIIDKYYGIWTFAAIMRANTKGVITPIENIPDLQPTLQDKQNQIDTAKDRINGSLVQATVNAVQGSNKRFVNITYSDGTTKDNVQTAAGYYPFVNDTTWVFQPGDTDNVPLAIGKTSIPAGAFYEQGHWVRAQAVAESQVHLIADHRLTVPADGGTYRNVRMHVTTSGASYPNSAIEQVLYGNDNAALERIISQEVGILWGRGNFYFTDAYGNNRANVSAAIYYGTQLNIGNGQIYAGVLNLNGQINMGANPIYAGVLFTTGIANSGGLNMANQTINCGQINMGTFPIYCGEIHCFNVLAPGRDINTDPVGIMHSLNYIGGNFSGTYNPGSDINIKTNFTPVKDSDVDELYYAKVMEWEYCKEEAYADGTRHISIIAQDSPEVMRGLHPDTRTLTIDLGSQINLMLVMIQRQGREIKALQDKLSEAS